MLFLAYNQENRITVNNLEIHTHANRITVIQNSRDKQTQSTNKYLNKVLRVMFIVMLLALLKECTQKKSGWQRPIGVETDHQGRQSESVQQQLSPPE
jgi:hypothetical protein